MKEIKGLLGKLDYDVLSGSLDGSITELIYDSRKLTTGCCFVCIKGAKGTGKTTIMRQAM